MTSNSWRIMFGLPFIFFIIQILGLIFFVKHEPLNLDQAFLNKNEEPEVYTMTMDLLYHQEDYSKEEIDMFIFDKFGKKDVLLHDTGVAENVTVRMALCSEKYRRVTLMAIVLAAIQ